MVKVLSFSLWGNNATYCIGAIRNAAAAREVYPDFECWFYIHRQTVPVGVIEELAKLDNVKIIMKDGDLTTNKPRTWRFEAIDDPSVEVMMSRDTDTRILPREVAAVKEWLSSNKLFHIMRDHPHHAFQVLAGMFGTKKIPSIISWVTELDKYIIKHPHFYDQDFLRDIIYPHILNDSVIHASFHRYDGETTNPFPIPYDSEFRFVGEYVYANETRSQPHIQALRSALA